ncbi:unnamed protein product, partial [Gadus morhua 'NCC']
MSTAGRVAAGAAAMLLLVVALLTPGLRAQVDTETRARAFLEKFSTEASVKHLISLQDKGSGALSPEKSAHLGRVMSEMSTIYSTAEVWRRVMADSRDYNERLHVWEGWRRETGRKMRPLYEDYVDLKNEAARLNGFEDYGAYWRSNYETVGEDPPYNYTRDELMGDVRSIYKEIMPLYKELHAYVRSKLIETYPGGHIHPEGPLPAHLLVRTAIKGTVLVSLQGICGGRFWTSLYPLSTPYPLKPDIDVSTAMVDQKWVPERLFREAEKFFMSVGLYKMEPDFWKNSMLEKPNDRKVVCHPTAWDMGNGKDYRIKMCTQVNMDHVLTAHHEMGPQPVPDGLPEPVLPAPGRCQRGASTRPWARSLSLSAATPDHLKSLGLLAADFTADK